jgi:hypothetical protein
VEEDIVDNPIWQWIMNNKEIHDALKQKIINISEQFKFPDSASEAENIMHCYTIKIGILEIYERSSIDFHDKFLSSDRLQPIAEKFILHLKQE